LRPLFGPTTTNFPNPVRTVSGVFDGGRWEAFNANGTERAFGDLQRTTGSRSVGLFVHHSLAPNGHVSRLARLIHQLLLRGASVQEVGDLLCVLGVERIDRKECCRGPFHHRSELGQPLDNLLPRMR
jgi:hypothetical protein